MASASSGFAASSQDRIFLAERCEVVDLKLYLLFQLFEGGVYVWVCVHTCKSTYIYTSTHKDVVYRHIGCVEARRVALGVLLHCSPPYPWRQGLLLNLGLD